MKIDIHTHIIPERMPDWAAKFGYGGFVHLDHHANCRARMMIGDKFFREVESNCWSADTRMEECNHHHVDFQVISTIPVMFSYWAKANDALELSRFLNDHIAEIVANHPTRFIGLGTIPMQDPEMAARELERCMDIGLAGVQIGTHIVDDWNLSSPALLDIFRTAAKRNAAVFVHPWEMMGQERMPRYWLPWLVGMPAETSLAICSMIFGGVFEKIPDLRVAFAHAGGSFPGTFGRIEHGFHARPDLVAIHNNVNPENYLGKFWVDSLTHHLPALKNVVDLLGEHTVCLGSDYPFPLGEDSPGKMIEESDFNLSLKEKLLWRNAENWLGRKIFS